VNIRDDEAEHVSTMRACQTYAERGKPVVSPHVRFRDTLKSQNMNSHRDSWRKWAEDVNEKNNEPVG
jgi:hypothetical protein